MFLIYAGLCVIAFGGVFFFVPETKGLPIEEIGALFGDSVAAHLTADGEGIVEDKQNEMRIEGTTMHEEVAVVNVEKV
jgi:hypothetical protein